MRYIFLKHSTIVNDYVSIYNILMTRWSWYSWHCRSRSWTDLLCY